MFQTALLHRHGNFGPDGALVIASPSLPPNVVYWGSGFLYLGNALETSLNGVVVVGVLMTLLLSN